MAKSAWCHGTILMLVAGWVLLPGVGEAQPLVSISENSIILSDADVDNVILDGFNGNIVLGGGPDDGDIFVRDSDANANRDTFVADGLSGTVTVGNTGEAGEIVVKRSNGLVTVDIAGEDGDLTLGGGLLPPAGSDGDLILQGYSLGAASFVQTIHLDGGLGDATLGAEGQDGDLFLRDTDGTTNNFSFSGDTGDAIFGSGIDDGDLVLRDGMGNQSIDLDGKSGNVTNKFGGNGLVKAWARINADGSILSCWRCFEDAGETQRLGIGEYEVDFNISVNITTRPWICSVGHAGEQLVNTDNFVTCSGRVGDPSSVYVETWDAGGLGGAKEDTPFTLVVF